MNKRIGLSWNIERAVHSCNLERMKHMNHETVPAQWHANDSSKKLHGCN